MSENTATLFKESKAWSYHRQPDGKDEWLTPPAIIKALGEFDLDPCAPVGWQTPWKQRASLVTS